MQCSILNLRESLWPKRPLVIQAILPRKSMKKYSVSTKLLTVKDNIYTDLRTSHAQFLGKGSQHGEEDAENKPLS